jgi:hypothetical protein
VSEALSAFLVRESDFPDMSSGDSCTKEPGTSLLVRPGLIEDLLATAKSWLAPLNPFSVGLLLGVGEKQSISNNPVELDVESKA